MQILRATQSHIPGMLRLLHQVGDVHHRGRPDIFRSGALKYDAAALEALLQDEDRPIFIAEEQGRVLGYGFCKCNDHSGNPVFTGYRELYIDDICVDEAARGMGVGRALYDHILAYARKKGCYNVTLNVWTCNPGAMRFYEKLGLKPYKVGMETIL
jgi:ribosomal protein S18 acetylase RimI-like enzyme